MSNDLHEVEMTLDVVSHYALLFAMTAATHNREAVGLVKNFRRMRERICDARPIVGEEHEWSFPQGLRDANAVTATLHGLILDLHAWKNRSGVLYVLSEDQQRSFCEGRYEHIVCGKVKFPVPSFFVRLAKPIEVASGRTSETWEVERIVTQYSLLHVSITDDDVPKFKVRLFPPKPPSFLLTQHDRALVQGYLDRGNVGRAIRLHEAARKKRPGPDVSRFYSPMTMYFTVPSPDELLRLEPEDFTERRSNVCMIEGFSALNSTIWKTVIGTCLYLTQAPTEVARERKGAVPHGPHVCPVTTGTSVFDLVAEAEYYPALLRRFKEPVRGGGIEQLPQSRKGSWRRPRGMGKDPNAAKTKWFPSYTTRKDLIAQGVPIQTKRVRVKRRKNDAPQAQEEHRTS